MKFNLFLPVIILSLSSATTAEASCTNEEENWSQAQDINTPTAYRKYISDCSPASYVAEAMALLRTASSPYDSYEMAKKRNNKKAYESYIRNFPSSDYVSHIKNRLNKLKNTESIIFETAKKENTIKKYRSFIKTNPQSPYVKNAVVSIFKLVQQENKIAKYQWFLDNYSRFQNDVIASIFKLVQQENNIAGYQWFLNNHPNTTFSKNAVKNMHKLAYEEAHKINTISSYNTFIITYPYAKEVEQAIKFSFNLERKKYSEINKDDERKARLLAVRIKKMTIAMRKQSVQTQMGYEIIVDRMSRLLTEQYEETDASLRYYESKEFTDFASKFEGTMRDIKSLLNSIEQSNSNVGRYVKHLIAVTKNGLANARSDKAMSEYNSNKHREWEKFMHYKDKGYN